jgi:CheY-like chemotaxis protein
MLVLVVDDNADVRALMQITLEISGYEVITAMHGGIGLDLVADRKPDAVLLDLMMPEVDGFQFLARLPARTASPPPVIVISGFDTYRDEVTKLGAFAYLEKPVDSKVLSRTLADALARRPPDAQLLQSHREEHGRVRDQAREQAQQLVRRLPLSDDRVMPTLQAVVDWLPRFFGFGTSIVQTIRSNDLTVEAVGGDLINGRGMLLTSGMSIPRQWSFCDDLLDEGSSLVLPDPRHHPCKLVAEHSEVTRLGWGFYLGVSIPTSTGVIGALCHLAKEPHPAHSEDADLLTALANRIGALLEAAATDTSVEPFINPLGCFAEDIAPVVLDLTLRRAMRRSRCGVLVRVALDDRMTPERLCRRIQALVGISAALMLGPDEAVTVILGGCDRDVTSADVDACAGPEVRATGCAWWGAPQSAPNLDAYDSSTVLADLAAEAHRMLTSAPAPRTAARG